MTIDDTFADKLRDDGWTALQICALRNYMEGINDDDYENSDNYRYARVNNPQEVSVYDIAQRHGCCGEYDEVIVCEDGNIMFGFNYGH